MGQIAAMPFSGAIAAAQIDTNALEQSKAALAQSKGVNVKAHAAAQDFESVFLNSMFSQMFTDMDGDGPFGGGPAVGVWRSMLTDEYSRSFAKNGGVGIADHVYRSLLAIQEGRVS